MPSSVSSMTASWYGSATRKNGAVLTGGGSGSAVRTRSVNYGSNWPDWKSRIQRSKSATTSLSGKQYTYLPPYFNFTAVHPAPHTLPPTSTTFIHRNVNGFPLTFPGVDPSTFGISLPEADNRALAQFVQRAVGARRSMQGGVFLGELKRTIAAVKNPAQSIRRGLDEYTGALKKRRRDIRRSPPARRRQTATSIAADTWLEYSFGWTPLFHDVQDAAEALAKSRILAEKPKTVFVSASGRSSTGRGQWTPGGLNSQNGLYAQLWYNSESYYSVKYYGRVKLYQPNSLQAQLGLLPEDFVPTVWELVPWSFLVDYFSNVGDIIQAACLCRSDMAWVAKGVKLSTVHQLKVTPGLSALTNHIVTGSSTLGSMSVSEVSRSAYGGSLIPSLDFEIPGFGKKWTNMAALGASLRELRPLHLL